MAVALTLADYAMQSNDPLIQKLTMSLLEDGSVLDDLPLVTRRDLSVKGRRVTGEDLPTTGWGKINKAPVEIKTTSRPYEESVSLVREMINMDRRLKNQPGWIDDPVDTQIKGAMASHNYDMNYCFFYNDPGAVDGNEDAWLGLQPRLKNPAKYGTAPGLRIDAGGVNVKQTMTAADSNNLLEVLGKGFAYLGVSDGRQCTAYTNWLMKERWARAVRNLGGGAGFKTTDDAFGREVERYRQCKVRDIGFKKDQSSLIIPITQDNTGTDTGSGDRTSIFICRYGDDHLKGWQTEDLKPEPLGRSTETGIFEKILIDWGCGIYHPNQRSFVEIYNLEVE